MRVSIISVNYNNKSGLEKTIDSVFAQTYQDIEYLVIDGGSSDGSKELLESMTRKIDYWVSEPDGGIYQGMNKGIRKASGDYLIFMNSGDTFTSDAALSVIASKIPSSKSIITGGLITSDGKKSPFDWKVNMLRMTLNGMHHQATLIPRVFFDEIGYYNESGVFTADWQWFMLAIFKHGYPLIIVDEFICIFDVSGITYKLENRQTYRKEKTKFLMRNFPFLSILVVPLVWLFFLRRDLIHK